ncbi:Replication protein A 70 kDa DNA-binding subunit [Tritrichomonas foetus]|uniref:Replication protein A subunit n=1 Tax=Tritrichomonas foetus TaxID=1144522 RepID=A0A1J4KCF5_9EUKA|nr:Replication protein A 70 kDa DNA-binding subunit [Tritrichomonas foetus]|eukprot:OHT09105.1 Replication protein A 70 kDa DNA-binding subunit [Tritrichomonas foetus]
MRPPTTGNFINISSLTMYINSWTILARVVQKSQKKNWTNNRGSGSLFSVTLKDKAGDEIRGTFFNEEAEKFYEEIEINHIYEITGGRIKAANTKFNNVNNMYEISFDKTTTFKEAAEDDSIGELTYDYVKLKDIADLEVNKIVDIIAICSQVDDCTQIHSNKTGKDLTKRTIYLVDDTNIKIECTLWNDEAINIPSTILNQVISIKEAKIGEFHGKNLGTTSSSILTIDPQVPEAQKLLSWWDSNKDNLGNFSSLSGEGGEYSGSTRMIYLEQINNGMGTGQKPDYFQCYASLQEIVTSRKLYYLACPNPSCKNKGVKSSDGSTYFCESCKQTIENPIPRYACTAKFNDFSGSSYFSLLGEDVGQAIIGMTAPEWRDLTDNVDEKEVRSIVQKNFFNFFKLKARAKEEYYNDESRVKLTVVSASKIDFGDAALFFAKEIQKFSQ